MDAWSCMYLHLCSRNNAATARDQRIHIELLQFGNAAFSREQLNAINMMLKKNETEAELQRFDVSVERVNTITVLGSPANHCTWHLRQIYRTVNAL